jgi:hypothetical protein
MFRGWSSWDGRALRRALGVGALMVGLAWLVTAATDEGNVAWSARLGRALPTTPICAAIGAWIAIAPARVRGELRALAALGRSPWQNARAAALGGALVAAVAAVAIGTWSRVDIQGFYPEIGGSADVRFEGDAFVDHDSGWQIDKDGDLSRAATPPAPRDVRVPPHGRAAAGLATFFAGLALALITAYPERRARWLGAGAAVGAAMLVLFQAAAAHRVVPAWAAVPPALLLAVAAARYREARWPTR